MINTIHYISFGLVGSYTVEDHVKGARQKSTQAWGASHGEGLSTSCDPVRKEQTCNDQRGENPPPILTSK